MTATTPREKWDVLASRWMRVQPPAAPSRQDADHYVRLCGGGTLGTALLLGCTPLLRSRLRDEADRLIFADISPAMVGQSVREVPPAENEVAVISDWLRMPLPSESVDCIAGDKVFDNVHPTLWRDWLHELARVLKPGGCFVSRLSPRGNQRLLTPRRLSFPDLVMKWADGIAGGSSSLETACSGLWEDCLAASTVPVSEQVGTQCIGGIVPSSRCDCLAADPGGEHSGELLELFIERYWSSRCATWTAYSLEGAVEAATESFAVSEILVSFDYPESERQPVVGFQRRATRRKGLDRT